MIELEKTIKGTGEVAGFEFTQIAISNNAFTYRVNSDEVKESHYEVFERKELKESDYVMQGKAIHAEAKVRYPKSNNFGVWAWCFKSLESAMSKFKQITNENPTKPHILNNPEHFKEIHAREAYQSNMN